MSIKVDKIIERNVDGIKEIMITHKYDKETKTLFFNVYKTESVTFNKRTIKTTHPKYEEGTED